MNPRLSIPRVSVIMPCYNHAAFVANSVNAILQQTLDDFELIIVDDASVDNSTAVLQKLAGKDERINLIVHDKNRGASGSRNDGLRAARGEYVAFCDADDLWKHDKLEHQINLLSEHSDYDIAYCDSEIIDANGLATGQLFSDLFPLPSTPSGELFEVLCERNFINMQTVIARRESLGEQLFFDERIQWLEDWWQWIRLSRHHQFLYEPSARAQYRMHQQSTSLTQKTGIRRHHWKVCKRNLRTHHDIPPRIKALIWYQMGIELCLMNRGRRGCRFLWQALRFGWHGGISTHKLTKMSAHLGLEWIRGMLLPHR